MSVEKQLNTSTTIDQLSQDNLWRLLPYLGLAGLAKLRINRKLDQAITPILTQSIETKRQIIDDFAISNCHLLVLNALGQAFSAGRDAGYCLGHGDMGNASLEDAERRLVRELTRIRTHFSEAISTPITQVAAHHAATILRTADDELLACGLNTQSRLGIGREQRAVAHLTPCAEFERSAPITDLQIGFDFSIVLNKAGKGWGCGYTRSARSLAFAPECWGMAFSYQPLEIDESVKLDHLAVGHTHYFAIDQHQHAHGMGNNLRGQLGANSDDDKPYSSFERFGEFRLEFNLPNAFRMNQVQHVACGEDFTFLYTLSGRLFSCGQNQSGQLALGHTNERRRFEEVSLPELDVDNPITTIACGSQHVVLATRHGQLYAAGSNECHAFADAAICDEVRSARLLAVGQAQAPIKKLLAGDQSTLYLDQNGVLHARGKNDVGQLGTDIRYGGGFFRVPVVERNEEWDQLMAKRERVFFK